MQPSSSMRAGKWHIDIQCAKCATAFKQRPQVWVA